MMNSFDVFYENQYGRIHFGGGGAPVYKTIKLNGVGPPDKEYKVTGYSNQAGQEVISQKDMARVITLSGDVRSGTLQQEISKMAKILYHPGTLKMQFGVKKRKIACRCTSFDDPTRKGAGIANFVVQFTADKPYFTDFSQREVYIYRRTPLLSTQFTLPCMFSSRESRVNVQNAGDVAAEPVIEITCFDGGNSVMLLSLDEDGEDATQGIKIKNHTTGQHMKLDYVPVADEVITVDIPNRKVTSSVNGSILTAISRKTFLSDFWLAEGVNDIEVTNYNAGAAISAVCRYDNQYVEAVY